jgi:hypothetical protein
MSAATEALREFIALVGRYWLIAASAAFIVMVFESAKPPPVEGEDEPAASPLQRLAMIASLAVPFLLFLDAFGAFVLSQQGRGEGSQGNGAILLGALGVAAVFVLAPGVLGWLIAKLSPALAAFMRRLAPFLALAVFVFTIYATYRNAFFVLNLYVLSRLR